MPIIRIEKKEIKLIRSLDLISPEDFKRGLAASTIFPHLPISISSREILPVIQSQAPADGTEIVEWMQLAASEGAILDQRCQEYNRLGSLLTFASTDPYLPGISCGDLRVNYVSGQAVQSAGATVITPRGNFNVPMGGKALGIFPDILAWARLSWAGSIQWLLSLLQWKDLASTPISARVGFPNLGGAVAPQFCIVRSQYFPPPAINMTMGFTSSRQQKVALALRSSGDYTNVLAQDTLNIPAGQSTLDYFVVCPGVTEFCLHLQPEDGTETILDSLKTTPP